MKTALYRHFDGSGSLLYIGIAVDPVRRLAQHKAREWFDRLARVDIEWLPTRSDALRVESEEIRRNRPPFNIQHAGRGGKPTGTVAGQVWVVYHLPSRYADGIYFDRRDAAAVLAMFKDEFPSETFGLVGGPPAPGFGIPEERWLRLDNKSEWLARA